MAAAKLMDDKAPDLLKALTAEKLKFLHERYEELTFKDPVPEELKCSLCDRLTIPNHIPPCNHSLCKPCFYLIISGLKCVCPLCNTPMDNVLKSTTRVIMKSLTLDVHCPNTKYGCETVKTYFELPDHFAECKYVNPEGKMPYEPKYDGDIRDTIKYNSFGTTYKDWILCNVLKKRECGIIEKTTPFKIDGLPFNAVVKFDFSACTAEMKIVHPKGEEVHRLLPPYPRVTYAFCNLNENHREYIFSRTVDIPYGYTITTKGDYHWPISFKSIFPNFHNFLPSDNVKVHIKADFPHNLNLDHILTGQVLWQIEAYQDVVNAQRQFLVDKDCSDYFYTHYDGYKVQAQVTVNSHAFLRVIVLTGENDTRLPCKPRFLFIVKYLDETKPFDAMTVLDRRAKFQDDPLFIVRLDQLKGWSPHLRTLLLDITVKVATPPYLEFEPKVMADLSAEVEENRSGFGSKRRLFEVPRSRALLLLDDVTKLMAQEVDVLGRSMKRPMSRMPIINTLRQIEDRRFEHKTAEKKELENHEHEDRRFEHKTAEKKELENHEQEQDNEQPGSSSTAKMFYWPDSPESC